MPSVPPPLLPSASLLPAAARQVALQQQTDPVVLAELMPRHWSDFVRNAPMDQVRPLGTRST